MGEIEDKKYFDSLRVCDQVNFIGAKYGIEKHAIFSISSLFVLPSYSENFGISIAEAMTYKIPVITTTGTPWQEIKENDAGWWIELTQENIDNTMSEALSCNDVKLKAKGKRGFDIIKHYTWDKQALNLKQAYEEVLNKKKENK